ncbi:MAG: hypothetical protein K6L73_02730 [Cellvibrionaceae bacterium]
MKPLPFLSSAVILIALSTSSHASNTYTDEALENSLQQNFLTQEEIKHYKWHAQIIGEAFNQKENKLVYREYHLIERNTDDYKHSVLYLDADDSLWAYKTITYGEKPQRLLSPSIAQKNTTNGKKLSVKHGKEQLIVSFGQKKKKIKPKEKYPLVVDAGFDHFIRAYWDKLLTGTPQKFDFVFPKGLRIIPMKAKLVACTSAFHDYLSKMADESRFHCFSLTPSNWALKLLAKPITLAYNQQQQLAHYSGISNISDKKNQAPIVSIHYSYKPYSLKKAASTVDH